MITYLNLGNYGRLGNQLWEIASTIGISIKNEHDFIFPNWSYSKFFNKTLPQSNTISNIDITITEKDSYYQDIKLDKKKNYNLVGYFQSWKYFNHCENLIREYFEPNFMVIPNHRVVGVHVRRTDYLNLQHVHPILELDYYRSAFEFFNRENYVFKIFSYDVQWSKENFNNNNFPGYNINFSIGKTDIEDLFELSACEHQIIANSSFGWWSAYLNDNPQKIIIAPENYVIGETRNDRIPLEWIRI